MYFVYAEVVQGGQSCLYVGIDDWLKISRQWEDGERSTVYNICTEALLHRVQELCESRGGHPGLPVPNSPGGLCGRKATLEEALLLFCLLFFFFLSPSSFFCLLFCLLFFFFLSPASFFCLLFCLLFSSFFLPLPSFACYFVCFFLLSFSLFLLLLVVILFACCVCGRKATLEALLLFCLLFVFFFFYFSFFFLLAVIVVVCLCLRMIFALWWTSCITLAHFMGALWSSSTILPLQCVHLLAMSSRG